MAGLSAAVAIKELNPDVKVLIIEKQTSGYSGKANKGGGVLQYFREGDITPEVFLQMHANSVGCYLGNQEMMLKFVRMNRELIDTLKKWGVKVPTKEDGSYNVHPMGPFNGMIGVDIDITIKIRQRAEKLGVKIIDKVTMSDLLVTDGKISGALAYSIVDGKLYEIDAKAVILATGSQNYRLTPMWSSGRGDGIAAAFRAGVELRNPEFGNFTQFVKAYTHEEVVFGENVLYDRFGQNVTQNFRRFMEGDVNSLAIAEWYLQMSAMRGPLTIHPDEFEPVKNEETMFYLWDRPYGLPFWKANYGKAKAYKDSLEVAPALIGEQSPIKVDDGMKTNIPGLFAAGDACWSGSCINGAVPPPGRNRGSGILYALFSGLMSAPGAVETAKSAKVMPHVQSQIDECIERIYAPLYRKSGHTAKEVINRIQQAIVPVEQSVYMSEHRIKIAMRMVEEAKEMAKTLKADDFHGLLSCHEAEAMVLSAELHYNASLLRKESRGWFLREDYPQMDNKNWLKWITVKNENGKMVFGTEDVPIKKWPIQPPVMR